MTREARIALGLANGTGALALLALALGCAAAGAADAAIDAGGPLSSAVDGGGPAPLDLEDSGADRLGGDGGSLADAPAAEFTEEGPDPDDVSGNAAVCFDGRDQDGNSATDCEESACATTRVCCVGSAAAACCAPTATRITFALMACAGDPETCGALTGVGLAARVVSGSPRFSADHALVPVSTAGVDGVVDFPSLALSPRGERIVVRATISAPASSLQLDATAVGLWTPQARAATVSPLVAVVVSATRRDVSLVVGDRVIDSRPLTEGAHDYALEVTPDGEVSVGVGGETLRAVVTLPAGLVVPVVFGRVINDAPDSRTTRVTALSVERHACDLPAALVRAGSLTAVGETSFEVLHATDPSILARPSGGDLVAFAAPSEGSPVRALYRATRGDDGRIEAPDAIVSVQSLADLTPSIAATDLGGPHLFEGAAGAVSMYFAYRIASGDWRIARLDDIDGASSLTVLPIMAGSFDDPAPLGGGRVLAREHLTGGVSRIVILDESAAMTTPAGGLCASESSCDGARPDAFIHSTSADTLAFDRDEVRAPVALEHGGVRRIYFAGRRGTRWSIGMLIEGDEGSFFRKANGGAALLGPSGTGDDALGVAGPSPIVRNGELELIYAGTDGARWQLLSARMPIR